MEKANSIDEAFANKVPRRAHLERNIPAELAIRDATAEVEKLGAHPALTQVVIKLVDALTELADWVDRGSPGQYVDGVRTTNPTAK
jgi:sirohydrochlorin ferrochelatase